MKSIASLLFLFVGFLPVARAADRPNLLWIVSEDNAWNWLGCYGNKLAATPRLDALAKDGVLFTHAYSNAPVCAVARSTILNGAYAVTQGTQHMRSRHPIPEQYKPYVAYLREQGYYCTNNAKTDYNFKGKDGAIWDACSGKATYERRPEGKPFFAIFNLEVSHESSLFPAKIASNRKNGTIPQTPRVDPSKVELPPYLPELPEIRSDIAIYHDNIAALDKQVGRLLDELKDAGLADDTIIFYYADHGGITPRGKRYLEDTGVRVPMMVHVPEKWKSLSPFLAGEKVDEMVAFVDLAPTLLSLVGLEKPAQMQGRAFLGPKRVEPAKDPVIFFYGDRFDEVYGMRRAISDAKWKYIRCFTPNLPAAPYSMYSLGQSGWSAWQKAWKDGKLKPPFNAIWESPQPVERLFDLTNDPMEIHDLANDSAQAGRLAEMRERLKKQMIDVADTGIIPEPMFAELSPGKPVASYFAARKADIPELVSLAFSATAAKKDDLPKFVSQFTSEDPITRYWALQGCVNLGTAAVSAADALKKLTEDPSSPVRVAAGNALFALGQKDEGKAVVIAELDRTTESAALQNCACVLTTMDALGEISDAWVKRILKDDNSGEYLKRLAVRLKGERK
jgi:N-sulfoglucosamine sulfohydrolase